MPWTFKPKGHNSEWFIWKVLFRRVISKAFFLKRSLFQRFLSWGKGSLFWRFQFWWKVIRESVLRVTVVLLQYTCGSVLACMQTKEFEMHVSTKIIVVTGLTTELHAGRQRVHFSILQPFLLTTTVTVRLGTRLGNSRLARKIRVSGIKMAYSILENSIQVILLT